MMTGNEFLFPASSQLLPVIGDGNKTINEISNGFSENAISQPRLLILGEMSEVADDYPLPVLNTPQNVLRGVYRRVMVLG